MYLVCISEKLLSAFFALFFNLILKRDSISFIMPIFMFLSQFLEILQGGGGGGGVLSQHSPGHNYTLNTLAQIGLIAVIKNGRFLTLPCDNKYLLLLASTDFFRAILCCWLFTSRVKLEIAQTPEFCYAYKFSK